MPPDPEYTLQDLADLADVTPRTIRYYVAQGLLPSPARLGPGAMYPEGHLNRLRLIKLLQREHLPLAEVRVRLAALDDATIAALVEAPAGGIEDRGSAVDYIRRVLGGSDSQRPASRQPALHGATTLARSLAPEPVRNFLRAEAPMPTAPARSVPETPTADRSQWDRILLAPDVELHVRRPLGRQQNKRVERLIVVAHEILQEDQS